MTNDDKQRELARYRIQQAKECLDEASFLFEGGKSLRSAVNRSYYAMFYSVLALIIFESYSTSKHSGVLSYFHQHFIKERIFPESFGRMFQKALR